MDYGEQKWNLYLNALLYQREVDPFRQWLTADARPAWDETGRLDNWLSDVFNIRGGNTELVQWASRFIFLGCVCRTMTPGIKLDEMPVLIGPQGIGKSTALRLVLPPDMPDLFNDGLHLAADPRIRAEALQGRAIVEASEMAGSTRAEMESLKAFLSRTDDGGQRMAYRRNPEAMPRRCIIVGTSNNPEHAITAWLPDHLKTAQTDAAEQARRKDEVMENAIESALATWGDTPVSLGELITEIKMTGQPNISQRAGAYMRKKGYERVRQDGRKLWRKQ